MTQPDAREGQAGLPGESERSIVPRKPGNAGGGKGPWFQVNGRRSDGREIGDEPSTLSGNQAFRVGGIGSDGGALTVSNSTLSGNSADGYAGGILILSGSATLNNSIVANSPGGDIVGTFTGSNNRTGALPLGPLQLNGGPTPTHALPAGSPVINAGSNALIHPGVATDQRGPGFPRIRGGTVDIGAVEANQTVTWSGGGADGNWTTGANWQGGVVPVPVDDLVFPAGAARPSNTNTFAAGTTFRSLTFSGAGYTLGGNALPSAPAPS